jgi:hypothetical protein
MIGLREDQQMKARMVTFLNHAAAQCGRGGATIRLAPDGGGSETDELNDTPQSGASPLPHWSRVKVRWAAGSAASKAAG